MGIFKRKRREAEADLDDADLDVDAELGGDEALSDADQLELDAEELHEEPEERPQDPPFDRADGPFDHDEVPADGSRLDLGALQVPAVPGMQVNLEVDAAQVVNAVQVALDGSFVQLQAFAAPRSFGLWPEIRAEIAQSIASQGGSAEVVDGPLGLELAATMPGNGPAVRFLGVDGPRWFLRAVLSGPAATDERAAARLLDAVRGIVVVRGGEAMAPRQLLPLRMPAAPDAGPSPARAQHSADDIKPFERGPEITEVR